MWCCVAAAGPPSSPVDQLASRRQMRRMYADSLPVTYEPASRTFREIFTQDHLQAAYKIDFKLRGLVANSGINAGGVAFEEGVIGITLSYGIDQGLGLQGGVSSKALRRFA